MIGGYQTTAVPYDEKIVRTYQETYCLSGSLFSALFSTKDRSFVLKLEKSLMDFMESNVNSYKLNPMNSYCRLLAHNIAEYHGLKHILANDSISVVVFKKFNSSDTPLEEVIGQLPNSQIGKSDKSDDDNDLPADSVENISENLKNTRLNDTDLVKNNNYKNKNFVKLADIPVPNNTLLFVAKKFYSQPNYYQKPYQNKGAFLNNMAPKVMANLLMSSLGDPMQESKIGDPFFNNTSIINENLNESQTEGGDSIDLNKEPLLEAEKTREEEYNKIMDDIYGESEYEIEPIDDDEGPIIDTTSNNSYAASNEFNNKGGKYHHHNARQNGNYGHRNNSYYSNQNRSSGPQGSMYKGNKGRQYYNNDYFNNSMNMGAPAFHLLHYNNFPQNGIPSNQPPFVGYPSISGNDFSTDNYPRQPSNYHEQSFNRHRN